MLLVGVSLAEDSSVEFGGSDVDKVLRRAKDEVRAAIRRFQTIEVGSILEARIVAELARGSRSVAELACQIFETDSEKAEYTAYYDRVRRALRILEGRGYVSRRLFGKDKPYRLTSLGLARLLRLNGQRPVTKWLDCVLFSCFATLTAVVLALAWSRTGGSLFLGAYSAFLVLVGASLTRLARMVQEVI